MIRIIAAMVEAGLAVAVSMAVVAVILGAAWIALLGLFYVLFG